MGRSGARNFKIKLIQEMKQGQFAHCDRLPRETELAEMLGISRTQLRDALSELEREGYISRRHGVGTVINRHVLAVENRADIETEFLDIIRSCGYRPGVKVDEIWEEPADSYIAEKLGIPEGTVLLCKRSICTADGKPAICCTDMVDTRRIRSNYTKRDFEGLIFDFMRDFCGVQAYMDLTEFHATIADETLSRTLGIPAGTPVLNMEEVDFDIEGNAIFYSEQYFVNGLIRHTVLRKKL